MGSKEREQHPLKDLKLSRRQFLKHAGLAAGSLIVLGAGVLETVGYAQEIDRVNKEVDRLYPPVPEDEFEKVKEQRRESWEKLNALAQEDNFEGISQFVSGEFQNTAQTWSQYRDWKEIHRSIASALIEARYPLIRIILDELSIWSGLIGGGIEAFISIPKLHVLGQREKEKKQMISVFHPEWTQTSPSRAEKAAFYQAVLSLPPVGGKYTVIKDGKP